MTGRLPDYFELDRFSITAEDIARNVFRCEPSRIAPNVLLTPIWSHEVFLAEASLEETITPEVVYSLSYQGRQFTLVRSGIGAPLTGDTVLALGCTPCTRLVFVGSVGGLVPGMTIGDLILPTESVSGDGFSTYLSPGPLGTNSFLTTAKPNQELLDLLDRVAEPVHKDHGVTLTKGTIFSTDCVIAQFHHIREMVDNYHCIGIEMETSAVFHAAELAGIRGAALLQISDLPADRKSLFSGRSEKEQERRRYIRRHVLPRIALEGLTAS
jgi:purine-nucleoside phosphorylase